MSTISSTRAAYNRPNIVFGQRRAAKLAEKRAALTVASDIEQRKINRMITLLEQAKIVTKDTTFTYNMSEVFRLAREITTNHVSKPPK